MSLASTGNRHWRNNADPRTFLARFKSATNRFLATRRRSRFAISTYALGIVI